MTAPQHPQCPYWKRHALSGFQWTCTKPSSSPAAEAVPTGDDTQKTISSLISENARLGAELKESNRLVELFSGKHDEQIRQQAAAEEREKVLNVIRPSVLYFALRMEEKLRKHDKDRGVCGWDGYTDPEGQRYLFNRLKDEVAECEVDISRVEKFIESHPEESLLKSSDEVIDIANFAMMMYTAFGPVVHSKHMAMFLLESLRREGEQHG